jgi:hypothetical protein
MHSISRFRARLATVLSLRRLSFSMEPIRIPPDRTFESVFLQGRVTTNHRFRRRFLLAVPLVRIHFPPAASLSHRCLPRLQAQKGPAFAANVSLDETRERDMLASNRLAFAFFL